MVSLLRSILEELVKDELDEASSIGGGMVSATGGSPVGVDMSGQHKTLWSGDEEGTGVNEGHEPQINEKRSKSQSATPKIVYHGTTTVFLPKIMAHGLSPNKEDKKNIWQGTDDDWLDSLRGIYLTPSAPGALSYAKDTVATFGGEPIVLTIQIIPQSLYMDEDDISFSMWFDGTLKVLNQTIYELIYYYIYSRQDYENIKKQFADRLHRTYSMRNPKLPLDYTLLGQVFDAAFAWEIERGSTNPENLASYLLNNNLLKKASKKQQDLASLAAKTADDIWDKLPEHNENLFRSLQDKITKRYASHVRNQGELRSPSRLEQHIGFSGRNKIIGITKVVRSPETYEEITEILYGNPVEASSLTPTVVSKIPTRASVSLQEGIFELIEQVTKNVLDKMGLSKATKNIRRGALSGEVYMDRHDSNKKRTKQVVSKVAKNLNKKPYSHDPPKMGLQEDKK